MRPCKATPLPVSVYASSKKVSSTVAIVVIMLLLLCSPCFFLIHIWLSLHCWHAGIPYVGSCRRCDECRLTVTPRIRHNHDTWGLDTNNTTAVAKDSRNSSLPRSSQGILEEDSDNNIDTELSDRHTPASDQQVSVPSTAYLISASLFSNQLQSFWDAFMLCISFIIILCVETGWHNRWIG